MKANKIGSLFLISVLALAGIGISYAGWTDSIAISGSVSTGHVDLSLSGLYSGTWVYKEIANHGLVRDESFSVGTAYETDPHAPVGTDYMLVAHAWAAPGATDDSVVLTYNNLFPCQDFCTDFVMSYSGIPVRVQGPIVIATSSPQGNNFKLSGMDWLTYLYTHPVDGGIHGGIIITAFFCDVNGNLLHDQTGNTIPVTVGTQLHDGQYVYVKVCIHIPQDQDYMSLSGTFSTTLSVIQWDEY